MEVGSFRCLALRSWSCPLLRVLMLIRPALTWWCSPSRENIWPLVVLTPWYWFGPYQRWYARWASWVLRPRSDRFPSHTMKNGWLQLLKKKSWAFSLLRRAYLRPTIPSKQRRLPSTWCSTWIRQWLPSFAVTRRIASYIYMPCRSCDLIILINNTPLYSSATMEQSLDLKESPSSRPHCFAY